MWGASLKLEDRGLNIGILVSAMGITGDAATLKAAHYQLAAALIKGRRILVIDRVDIEALEST